MKRKISENSKSFFQSYSANSNWYKPMYIFTTVQQEDVDPVQEYLGLCA